MVLMGSYQSGVYKGAMEHQGSCIIYLKFQVLNMSDT